MVFGAKIYWVSSHGIRDFAIPLPQKGSTGCVHRADRPRSGRMGSLSLSFDLHRSLSTCDRIGIRTDSWVGARIRAFTLGLVDRRRIRIEERTWLAHLGSTYMTPDVSENLIINH